MRTHPKLRPQHRDEAGFLATDAMVGLLIAAIGLVMVIQAHSMAMNMLRVANAARLGSIQAQVVLESQWPRLGRPGELAGEAADRSWAWSLNADAPQPIAGSSLFVCRVSVRVRAAHDRRAVVLNTRRLCGRQS